ncbi:MAG: alpha/beta hydrolase [Gammaproteobacteria bacterium]|nr:alpha/beta hydrolase [Gammaproteobacteria bacterium]
MSPVFDSSSLQPSLAKALPGERYELNGQAGRLSYYVASPGDNSPSNRQETRPLLLIHSINAAASAHEMLPLFEYYKAKRPVYAPDLPGYGFSDRSRRAYSPRLMTDALHDMVQQIHRDCGKTAVDALGLSLACEFLSRAAVEAAESFRALGLVSPTGFNRKKPLQAESGTDRGIRTVLRLLTLPRFGKGLFRLLVSPSSIRFFLQKTWGSKAIDEHLYDYACQTARQAGAEWAPFYFLSGFLFSADINAVYASLTKPVWMCHGVRGDFTDYRLKRYFENRTNWHVQVFETGAMPYFESRTEFMAAWDEFLEAQRE